jgi:type I restriction enzyme S subunit
MKGWKAKPLGDVCTLQRGFDLPTQNRRPGAHPLISSSGIVDTHDESRVQGPGVITGRSGSIGNVFYVERDFWPLNTALYVRDFHDNFPRFVYYLLIAFDLKRFSGGAGVPTLNRNDVHNVTVLVPESVEEQQRIVASLDEAFEAIATAKANAYKNLQNAREVFQNHLERVFARRCDLWPETSIGAIAAIKGGKRVPKGYKLLDEDTGHPYLRVTDFGLRGSINMNDLRYVTPTVHAEIKNYIITPRDLYISIAGTIGRTGIIPDELDGANLTENACRLVFKHGVSNRFVYYYTRTPAFIKQVGFNTRTAAQPKLALSRLATIRLPLPEPQVQASVVATLDALAESVEVLEGLYQSKATALDELKKSFLQQAFTGVLTTKTTEKQLEAVA